MPKKPAKKPFVPRRKKPTGKLQKIIASLEIGASKHFSKRLSPNAAHSFYRSAKDMGRNPSMEADGNGGITIILDRKRVRK